MANQNKVEFGLNNVHVSFESGGSTWETPQPIPGAVTFTPEVESEDTTFFADNSIYYSEVNEAGIKGELEMALFPDFFLSKALGYKKTADGGIVQIAGAAKKNFILMFEGEGDKNRNRYMFLNCNSGAIKEEYKTNEKGKTIKVQKISITITGLNIGNDRVLKIKYPEDETGYSNLFKNAPSFGGISLKTI